MEQNVEKIRKELDEIDNTILSLLIKRFSLVKVLGKIKKEKKVPIKDAKREKEKMLSLFKRAEGISETFIKDIWQRIFSESYKLEA